ncbi:MAG: hypothetical protein M1539_03345 [Actinobacteria bacterium]|nr:hypothetical protein [Actinomycetota bacterium]
MSDILRQNQFLLTSQMISSPNGNFFLVLQPDSNLVLYEMVHHEDGSLVPDAVWATNTVDQDAWFAAMQEDGNFVLADENGAKLWETETDGKPGSFLQLQDDGNLVINEVFHAWTAGMEDDDDEAGDEDEAGDDAEAGDEDDAEDTALMDEKTPATHEEDAESMVASATAGSEAVQA